MDSSTSTSIEDSLNKANIWRQIRCFSGLYWISFSIGIAVGVTTVICESLASGEDGIYQGGTIDTNLLVCKVLLVNEPSVQIPFRAMILMSIVPNVQLSVRANIQACKKPSVQKSYWAKVQSVQIS